MTGWDACTRGTLGCLMLCLGTVFGLACRLINRPTFGCERVSVRSIANRLLPGGSQADLRYWAEWWIWCRGFMTHPAAMADWKQAWGASASLWRRLLLLSCYANIVFIRRPCDGSERGRELSGVCFNTLQTKTFTLEKTQPKKITKQYPWKRINLSHCMPLVELTWNFETSFAFRPVCRLWWHAYNDIVTWAYLETKKNDTPYLLGVASWGTVWFRP